MAVEMRPVRRTVIGDAPGIAAALDTAARQGRLVSVSSPRPHMPGRYVVTAVLLEPVQRPAQHRSVPCRKAVVAVVGLAITGVLVATGLLLVVLMQWVTTHLPVIVGVLVALVVLAGALRSKAGVCMGLHCRGCGH